jgi:hypothetical protein
MKKIERKKLALSRETVRTLDGADLLAAKGGLQQVGIVSSDNQECTYSRDCQTW